MFLVVIFCYLFVINPHPGQNGRYFADDIFRCIFMNEKFYILIKILLNFVPKVLLTLQLGIDLDNGLSANRRHAIIWANADLIHWRMYVALGGDALSLDVNYL